MKHNRINKYAIGLAALCSLMSWGSIMGASAPVRAAAQTRTIALEAGSVIPVKLDDALSSKNSRKGDTFTATIRNDTDTDYYRLPAGTRVEGVVRDVRSQKDKDPGVLDLDFRRLRFPDGKSYAIEGSLIGLDNKSVEKRSDGRLVAKPGHSTDRLTYVGYGAGAGLIVGLLTKHGIEDTVLGGGLGYLFGSLQKGGSQPRDVSLKQGTELGVRMDKAVSLASYSSQDDFNNRNRADGSRNPNINSQNQNDDVRNHRADGNGSDSNSRYRRDDQGNTTDTRNNRPDDRGNRGNQDGRDIAADRDRGNSSDIGMMIGDRNVTFASTARPFLSKGVVMLPVRPVLDAAHIPFTYDAPSQQVRATGDGGRVRLALNSSIAVVDGNRRVNLGAPAQRLNGTLYVPMRFFGLVTGNEATYDAGSRTVVMNPRDSGDNNRRSRDDNGRNRDDNRPNRDDNGRSRDNGGN